MDDVKELSGADRKMHCRQKMMHCRQKDAVQTEKDAL